MTSKSKKYASTLENLISIQRDSISPWGYEDEYMIGLLNGLIVAKSAITHEDAKFYHRPSVARCAKIRHKSNRRRKVK